MSAVGATMTDHQALLKLVGGLFLCYLGASILVARPADSKNPSSLSSHARVFASTFLLTLMNPLTILSFAAIYAGLAIEGLSTGIFPAIMLTVGVFAGSAAWWLLLSSAAAHYREKWNAAACLWLNRGSGAAIVAFGALALFSALELI
jgi:threonine/homoserine/homoserine lactone efflux protein